MSYWTREDFRAYLMFYAANVDLKISCFWAILYWRIPSKSSKMASKSKCLHELLNSPKPTV